MGAGETSCLGLDRTVIAVSPDGERFALDVSWLQLHTPVSRLLLRIPKRHPDQGAKEAPHWSSDEALHPDRLVDKTDDLIGCIGPFILVFIVETLIATLVFGAVVAFGVIVRHRWTCRVTDATGEVKACRARGMRRVRQPRDDLADAIRSGNARFEELCPPPSR